MSLLTSLAESWRRLAGSMNSNGIAMQDPILNHAQRPDECVADERLEPAYVLQNSFQLSSGKRKDAALNDAITCRDGARVRRRLAVRPLKCRALPPHLAHSNLAGAQNCPASALLLHGRATDLAAGCGHRSSPAPPMRDCAAAPHPRAP